MDSSPLDIAYSLVKKADHAMMQGDFSKSTETYLKASQKFQEAVELTMSMEARRTLHALAGMYEDKATQLSDPNVVAQLQKLSSNGAASSTSPPGSTTAAAAIRTRSDDLTASLASARGIPLKAARSKSSSSEEHDPFYTFYSLINQTFARAYNSALDKAMTAGSNLPSSPDMVSDSFYVVPTNDSNSTREELVAEISNLRSLLTNTSAQLHAYEMGVKAQKDITKAGLNQLKSDVTSRESASQRQYDSEVEQLRSENDKLKIQIGRLKSRWDDLKQQARKKREPSVEPS